ncbi:23S rRNA (guanosine-2'-O-)-methyltransferase RlmB OS=Castellaniella defragrans OX=75697 GN=rlmB PE=3 SV=1 [Castellaniella defragrans]
MSSQQILAGFHAVQARLRHAPDSIRDVYLDTGRQDARMQHFIQQLDAAGVRWHAADAQRLEGLAHGVRHQGIVALASARPLAVSIDEVLDPLQERHEPALLLILDGVTDPHNLGACLRTADAAGVHAVIAPKDRAVGLNTTVQRVACGAADTVPYLMVTNLARTLRALRERDIWLVGTDNHASRPLHEVDAQRAMAWVMGAEGEGMRRLTRETCDELVAIPMKGSVESLNVSVASAVCLYESVRQRLGSSAAASPATRQAS